MIADQRDKLSFVGEKGRSARGLEDTSTPYKRRRFEQIEDAPCTVQPLRAWCLAVGLGQFVHVLACPVLPIWS